MKQEDLEQYLSRPKKRSRKVEAKRGDNAAQMRCWKEWRRERLATLFKGPYGLAVRQLVRFIEHLETKPPAELIEVVKNGPWRDADPDTRFTVLCLIDTAIVRMRERQDLAPFDDPLPYGEAPLNAFLILRKWLLRDL